MSNEKPLLIPNVYKRGDNKTDYKKLINSEVNALFIFNDNVQDHKTTEEGSNNAVVRPYNMYRKDGKIPISAGISTGTKRGKPETSFKHLIDNIKVDDKDITIQEYINSEIKEIKDLIEKYKYEKIYFSAEQLNNGQYILGTSIFNPSFEVKQYITDEILKLGIINKFNIQKKPPPTSLGQDNNTYIKMKEELQLIRNLGIFLKDTGDIKKLLDEKIEGLWSKIWIQKEIGDNGINKCWVNAPLYASLSNPNIKKFILQTNVKDDDKDVIKKSLNEGFNFLKESLKKDVVWNNEFYVKFIKIMIHYFYNNTTGMGLTINNPGNIVATFKELLKIDKKKNGNILNKINELKNNIQNNINRENNFKKLKDILYTAARETLKGKKLYNNINVDTIKDEELLDILTKENKIKGMVEAHTRGGYYEVDETLMFLKDIFEYYNFNYDYKSIVCNEGNTEQLSIDTIKSMNTISEIISSTDIGGGHYISFVKKNNKWYMVDAMNNFKPKDVTIDYIIKYKDCNSTNSFGRQMSAITKTEQV